MSIPYFDAHCDTLTQVKGLRRNEGHIDLERLHAYGPAAQLFAIFARPGVDTPENYRKWRDAAKAAFRDNADLVAQATSADEVRAVTAAGKTAAILAVEGAALLDCSFEMLSEAYEDGVRFVTLTWNKDNALCGSAADSRTGLTAKGVEFVNAMWDKGMAVDLSHCSEATFWDVLNMAKKPVICTHSDAAALQPHQRNLTDEQIRAMVANGGCIGLNFYAEFLGLSRDINAIIAHAKHMLDLGAEKCLCLGGDLDGIDEEPKDLHGVQDVSRLYDAMLSAGIPENTVQDIFWNNLLSFMERAL